ncbi:MAG: GntR family transcriptional regulator [Chloroflexi bacterium]|nr:GntR family transcriptional regulator [Chloroflexota bacterium]MBV9134079.1 GntR family transcriptional regulator [Chloroflexota bacterium]
MGRAAAERVPRAERIYAVLKQAILDGRLPPGASLREEELGRSHSVSRTPVREALSRLESEGLAARHPRSGLVVSAPTLDEIIDAYVVREALEGLAARLAAERRTELDLTRLQILLDAAQTSAPSGNNARLIDLGQEFHYLVWRITGNQPLQRALRELDQTVQRFQPSTLSAPGRSEASIGEHVQLLDALRARDAAESERLAVDHVRRVRNLRIALSVQPQTS